MTWTTIAAVSGGDAITSARENQIIDNLNYLLAPSYTRVVTAAGTTTTTSTSFAAIGSLYNLITSGGHVLVHAQGCLSVNDAANTATIGFRIDGTVYGSATLGYLTSTNIYPDERGLFCFTDVIPSLSAASHAWELVWKTSAGTATLTHTAVPLAWGFVEI